MRWRAFPNSSPPHRSRLRRFVISCPGGPLLSPPDRRLQPFRLLVAEGALLLPLPQLHLGHSISLHNGCSGELPAEKAGAGQAASLKWLHGASGSCSSGDGDCTTPSPGLGPGGESFVSFFSVPPLAPEPVVTKTSKKEQLNFSPGSKRVRMAEHETQSLHSRPLLLSPVGSRVQSEDAMPSPAPPAQPWS